MNNFINNLKKYPLGASGLSLGLMGYCSLVDNIFREYKVYNGWYFSIISLILSLFFISLLLIKTGVHKNDFKKELNDSLASSFLPTFAMVLMTWAGFIAGWSKTNVASQIISTIVMVIAVTIHLLLIINFSFNVMVKHKWKEKPIYGSWFVPHVGIITSVTMATRFNQNYLPLMFFQVIWFIGFIFFVSSFFIFSYLLLKTKPEHERRPSFAVYFAPVNLSLAGFCNAFLCQYNNTIYSKTALLVIFVILLMMSFSLSIYLLIYCTSLFVKNKLDYIFSSLTFPLAITSTAMFSTSVFLYNFINNEIVNIMFNVFRYYSLAYTCIAGIVIFTILILYFYKLIKLFKTKENVSNDKVLKK